MNSTFFFAAPWLSLSLGVATLTGCGNTSFGGATGSKVTPAAEKSSAPNTANAIAGADGAVNHVDGAGNGGGTPAPSANLTWDWPCASAPSATTPAPSGTVFVGPGAHPVTAPVSAEIAAGTTLKIAGQVCQPSASPRDVLFVIDVSGSMQQNDFSLFGNCGRLTAIETVIKSIPPGNVNYAILTFDSNVEAASTAMFPTQAQLFADIAPGGNIASVVCVAGSDTNYQAALTKASTILSAGRVGASKELYFVSDGEPTSGEDGMTVAQQLTQTGVTLPGGTTQKVTLATVMLNGDGAQTEIAMSSLDPTGQPLHADVANAAGLTAALTKLSSNSITSAQIQYRATGTFAYTNVNLMPLLNSGSFTLPNVSLNKTTDPHGLDVILEYTDQHQNTTQSTGTLSW